MKQYPFIESDDENVIAVLGKQQLQISQNGQMLKSAYCVATDKKLYIGGNHYFQNYVGDWKRLEKNQSREIADVTNIEYQRKRNPTELPKLLFRLMLAFAIIAILLFIFIDRHKFYILAAFMFILSFVVNAIIDIGYVSKRKKVMLVISVGCEKFCIKTAWYEKEELDLFYNQLIQTVTDAHTQEKKSIILDTGKTYAGEKILTELGEEYRQHYMKDKKTEGGFLVLTPTSTYINGKYYVRLLPGIWYRSRKERKISILDIIGVEYSTKGNIVIVIIVMLWLTYILALLIAKVEDNFSRSMLDVIWPILASYIPLTPIPFRMLFRKLRLSIKSKNGTYGLWTYWYSKDSIMQFQKAVTKIIEENKTKLDEHRLEPVQAPMIPAPVVPTKTTRLKDSASVLREYNQLLHDGIIDQEEFNKVKAEILSQDNK